MNNKLIDAVVIVDGASTAAHLAPGFRSYGVKCVHVISSPSLARLYKEQFNAHDYVREIVHNDDLANTVSEIRSLGLDIAVVLHGLDSACELADQIAHAIGARYRNPLETSAARRHKYLMIETVRRAGLRAPAQLVSKDPSEIMQWVRELSELPVVIKPTKSAGVAGVKICRSLSEVKAAAKNVLATTSIYEQTNDEILVQSFSQGQEYIVDSVSFNGRHKVISVWEVERDRRNSPHLDKMVVVDHSAPRYSQLLDYAARVLDALGVTYGPTHLEIIDTAAGPVIVELNARLHGSLDPRLTSAVTGENQVSATVEAFVCPEIFLDELGKTPKIYGHCGHILLLSKANGVLLRDSVWPEIGELQSTVSIKQWARLGDIVTITTDLRTAMGAVGVFSKDYEQVVHDWKKIRSLEDAFFSSAGSVHLPSDVFPEDAECAVQ